MKRKLKDFIVDPKGQWNHPGKKTYIPNANGSITMRGVKYPVLGIDDQGNQQMMYPDQEYQFPGNGVYEIPMAQKGLQTGKKSYELYQEYLDAQKEVNQRQSNEDSYEGRLNAALIPMIGKDIKTSGFVPQSVLDWRDPDGNPGNWCIGGVCWALNEIGEPIKYFSNTDLEKDVLKKKVKGRSFDYSEKDLKPGDILQFNNDSEKGIGRGGPHHAYLVTTIHPPDKDGNRKVEVFGNDGDGIQGFDSYMMGPDNKINGYATQVIKREVDPELHNSIIKRDALKQALEKDYPNLFKKLNVDTDTFKATAFVKSDYLYDSISESGDYDESIDLSESKLDEILTQFSNPDFKKNFMKQQQVSNDEYDAIVKNVIGIYGAESKFGTGYDREPLWIQKTYGALTDSIGPFQINPKQLQTDRFDRKDFFDPVIGSEIAATFLAENLPLLRSRAKAQPGDKHYSENLNQDNYLDFIPYLMNQQGLLKGDEYTKETHPGRLARFFGVEPTPTPENKLVGDSEYNLRVKDYAKRIGLDIVPASTDVFETPVEEPQYQSGGTFDPDTDEFIGFSDELPQAQDGLEKKGFDSLSESQKALLQKGNNLDKVKGWYEKYPDEMQNYKGFLDQHNADDYLKLYDTEKGKFDESVKNNADWHKDWYAKRAQLPQFKDVATQRLNNYTDQDLQSTNLIDPINFAFNYWELLGSEKVGTLTKNGMKYKLKPMDVSAPPSKFEFPTDKLYGRNDTNSKQILINSKLVNQGYYDVNGKLYNQTVTHETGHKQDDDFPQEGTTDHIMKNEWENGDATYRKYLLDQDPSKKNPRKDPLQNVIGWKNILQNKDTEGGSWLYQYHPTELRSRLDVWRQYNNIDALKDYSEDEIREIMQKNLSDPNVPRNIKELYQTIEYPDKLKYLHNSYVSNDKQSPLDRFIPQDDIQKAQDGLETGERFVEMDIPSQRYHTDSSEGRTYIKDSRIWNPVTNSRIVPTRDLKGGDYSNNVIRRIVEAAYRNNMEPDTYVGLSMALQETNLGETDPELGHVLHVKPYANPTPEDDLFRALKEKYEVADKLGYRNNPLQRLQTYNGNYLNKDTERKYHKGQSQAFYGVPVPEEGINLRKNPLYAKKIFNLRDSVLLQNPQLVDFVNKTKNDYADKYSIEQAQKAARNIDLTDMNQVMAGMAKFAKTNPREYKRLQQAYLKNNKKQTGGTFNPDTDEFIKFSDELHKYQIDGQYNYANKEGVIGGPTKLKDGTRVPVGSDGLPLVNLKEAEIVGYEGIDEDTDKLLKHWANYNSLYGEGLDNSGVEDRYRKIRSLYKASGNPKLNVMFPAPKYMAERTYNYLYPDGQNNPERDSIINTYTQKYENDKSYKDKSYDPKNNLFDKVAIAAKSLIGSPNMYSPLSNKINYISASNINDDPESDNLISELTHAYQQNKLGKHIGLSWINEMIHNPTFTSKAYQKKYRDPNSFEHKAHSIIEPRMREYIDGKISLEQLHSTFDKKEKGGTFNPNTDEFIGYSDELNSYQNKGQVNYTGKKGIKGEVPVNKEGLPYVNLREVEITSTNPNNRPNPYSPASLNDLFTFMNPMNWGVNDYSNAGTFNKAYNKSRTNSEKEFIWNNQRYNTRKDTDPIPYIGTNSNQKEFDTALRKEYPEFFKILNRGKNVGSITFEGLSEEEPDRASINPKLINSNINVGENPLSTEQFISNLIAETGHLKDPKSYKNILNPYDWKSIFNRKRYGDPGIYDVPGTHEYIAHRLIEPGMAMIAYGNLSPSDVKRIQKYLGVKANGYFGPDTYKAMQSKYADNENIKKALKIHSSLFSDFDKYPIDFGLDSDLPMAYLQEIESEVPLKNRERFSNNLIVSKNYSDNALLNTIPESGDYDVNKLQTTLVSKGIKLPKSTTKYGELDGVWGDETKQALVDWQSKNKNKKQKGGENLPFYQKGKQVKRNWDLPEGFGGYQKMEPSTTNTNIPNIARIQRDPIERKDFYREREKAHQDKIKIEKQKIIDDDKNSNTHWWNQTVSGVKHPDIESYAQQMAEKKVAWDTQPLDEKVKHYATETAFGVVPEFIPFLNIAKGAKYIKPVETAFTPIVNSVDNIGNATLRSTGSIDEVAKVSKPIVPQKPSWVLHEPETNSLQIKSTMIGSPLEKQLSKSGEININNLRAHIGKSEVGQQDKFIIDKVLNEKFPGATKIDYNDFRKAVSEELVPLQRNIVNDKNTNWGVGSLGYPGNRRETYEEVIKFGEKEIETLENILKNPDAIQPTNWATKEKIIQDYETNLAHANFALYRNRMELSKLPLENNSIVYHNTDKFGRGSGDHFDENTLGHARTLVSQEEPDIMHMIEQQSDYWQKLGKQKPIDVEKYKEILKKRELAYAQDLEDLKKIKETKIDPLGNYMADYQIDQFEAIVKQRGIDLAFAKGEISNPIQKQFLGKNHQERLLQENIIYAVEQGKSKMRYPTSETAAKIQKYNKKELGPESIQDILNNSFDDVVKIKEELAGRPFTQSELDFMKKLYNDVRLKNGEGAFKFYEPAHQTILQKYDEMPKMIKKTLGKDAKTVTDSRGNTWYEFDIPENFKKGKAELKALALGGAIVGTRKLKSKKQEGSYNPNTDEFLGFVD